MCLITITNEFPVTNTVKGMVSPELKAEDFKAYVSYSKTKHAITCTFHA